jgi:adenylate cyclase
LCNLCEQFAERYHGGAEIELSMLFADIRGSTSLAEGMSPSEFKNRIERFYNVTTHLMIESNAMIGDLIGDEVTGMYAPGLACPNYVRVAVETAHAILHATGHADAEGPWVPIGIGVHTGVVYVGAVGSKQGMTTFTMLGDPVNTTARLASAAGRGEVLVSEAACRAAGLDVTELEARHLSLKGKDEPVGVRVVQAATALPPAQPAQSQEGAHA